MLLGSIPSRPSIFTRHEPEQSIKQGNLNMKLTAGQKHLLKMIARDANSEGWTTCSKLVFPLLADIPQALVETELVGSDGKGRARLTQEGLNIISAMEYL